MIRLLCLLMLSGFAFGNDLLDQLHADLTKDGETRFTPIQIAMIADGVDDAQRLEELTAAWENFIADMALDDKKLGQPAKKKLRQIEKNLRKKLKTPVNDETGFAAMMEQGAYNRVSLSWTYARLGNEAGLASADYAPLIPDTIDPWFFKGDRPDMTALAAGWLAYVSYHLPDEEAARMGKLLACSNALMEGHGYEQETLGKLLYNRTLDLHNKDDQLGAALVGIGSAKCYPELELYAAVLYNIGIKLMLSDLEKENPARVTEIVKQIAPLTGEYQQQFQGTLDNRAYNYAAQLYNAKKFDQAMVAFENLENPPNPDEYRKVLTSIYVIQIEDAFEKNKDAIPGLMAKLEAHDADQHTVMKQRLNQLELIELDKRGDLDKALAKAAEQVDTEVDRRNYTSILIRFNKAKRKGQNYEEALELLDTALQDTWVEETLTGLRYDTYFDMLDQVDENDWKAQLKIYDRIFADKKLDFSVENGDVMKHNYGNALYKEISKLIEDHEFEKADAKSKAALKRLPKHKELTQQRDLINRILERIGG